MGRHDRRSRQAAGRQKQTRNGNQQERTMRCHASCLSVPGSIQAHAWSTRSSHPLFWGAPRFTPRAKLSIPLLPPPLHRYRCPPPVPPPSGKALGSLDLQGLPSIAIAIDRRLVSWWSCAPLRSPEQPTTSLVTLPCSAPAGRVSFGARAASSGMAFHEVETPRRC